MTAASSLEDVLGLLGDRRRLYLPGTVVVPRDFIEAMLGRPDCSRGLDITTSITPGIPNPLDMERLHASARVTGVFMQPSFADAYREGRYRPLPTSFYGFVRYLKAQPAFDVIAMQVAPPDADGKCSLSLSGEFTPLAFARSRQRIALINPRLPPMAHGVSIRLESFDHVVEVATPPYEYTVESDVETREIGRLIAGLIRDGDTLQMGLGRVPTALAEALVSHRKLRLWSGMLSDGMKLLMDAGALDRDFAHTTCTLAGTRSFYEWAADCDLLQVTGCEVSHSPLELARQRRLVSVNSAIEVDLLGQCNLEIAGGKAVSSVGGAPDFAAAARRSEDGLSIIALNASYQRGGRSRIVSRLSGGVASLTRCDVDCVVTEFGVADLRYKSPGERAEAIAHVAAPAFREQLLADWTM